MIAAIIVGAVILLALISKGIAKSRGFRLYKEELPDELGVHRDKEFEDIVHSLEDSLPIAYVQQVKQRMKGENTKDDEVEWTFFEMKRYFLLNAVIKDVPMFSARVDEVWHEMIMFTVDYERFTEHFFNRFLHHQPNVETTPSPQPNKRAFFDWVYAHLFDITGNSRLLWGKFFQHPLDKSTLQDFQRLSEDELLDRYFLRNGKWEKQQRALIQTLKEEITAARKRKKMGESTYFKKAAKKGNVSNELLFQGFVFYSLYEATDFSRYMNELLLYKKTIYAGDTASYSGYSCSSPWEDHHHHHDSGSSCSSSNCSSSSCSSSSCGSGCSSS
ncbi:hypothetical protein [Priestia aryabhattai]|uniref:hypothetical protein n=1 Tax=Priestia aryabhattai TaxID=412384 RepID=UPI00190C114A|nr:hypothetical protein [Priestia aryabhattai]MBK0005408.1 hypothetical protein [Bacillus sp. S35]MCM3252481.1 hypothetical protein [Priestia aryabhattai]MCM3641836.1 hypothetical protein [Priestia aryabhattai]